MHVEKIESISIDEEGDMIQSSRKPWEEDLVESSMKVSYNNKQKFADQSETSAEKQKYIDKPIKLNNFVAAPPGGVNRFSSIKQQDSHRKASVASENNDDEYDDYEEDFESMSMSKSMAGLTASRASNKKITNHDSDSYSGE